MFALVTFCDQIFLLIRLNCLLDWTLNLQINKPLSDVSWLASYLCIFIPWVMLLYAPHNTSIRKFVWHPWGSFHSSIIQLQKAQWWYIMQTHMVLWQIDPQTTIPKNISNNAKSLKNIDDKYNLSCYAIRVF